VSGNLLCGGQGAGVTKKKTNLNKETGGRKWALYFEKSFLENHPKKRDEDQKDLNLVRRGGLLLILTACSAGRLEGTKKFWDKGKESERSLAGKEKAQDQKKPKNQPQKRHAGQETIVGSRKRNRQFGWKKST